MNKEEKRHVGRPTNEEVKLRRNKKIAKVSMVALLVVALVVGINVLANKGKTEKLKGNVAPSVIKTYSVVKEGAEPNKCTIGILDLSGNKLTYQVRCQANARPSSIRLEDNGKETIILKDFDMHKGYFNNNLTYNVTGNISKNAKLKLYYKKQYIDEKKNNNKQTLTAVSIYKNGNLNKSVKLEESNAKNVPNDKCTISVSNIKDKSFKWAIKCDKGAKPKSVRLETQKNGKNGSQVAILRKEYKNDYGKTESKTVSKYVKPNTNYVAVLYFGTKDKGYYRTEVSFKTLKKDEVSVSGYIHTGKTSTTKPANKLPSKK